MEAPKTKEEEVADNIRQAVELAGEIHKAVSNPDYLNVTTPETRYQELMKRYPQFAQVYPVCLRMLSHNKYNEKAFRQFLEKQRTNPGSGMAGFIERQADYARFLYIEDTKACGRHVDMKKAARIWNEEHSALKKWSDKIKKDEADAKNHFEDEQKKHLEQKRNEFLNFINTQSPALHERDPVPTLAETEEMSPEDAAKAAKITEVAPSITEIDTSTMTPEERAQFLKDLHNYADELNISLNQMDAYIEDLEEKQRLAAEDPNIVEVPSDWKVPTNVPDETKKKAKKKPTSGPDEIDTLMASMGLNDSKNKKKGGKAVKTTTGAKVMPRKSQ